MTDVRVDRTGELVTVAVRGRLTLEGVPQVREVLLKCLADCPTGLVVDLDGLDVDSDLPLVVFPTIARHARAWLGAPPVRLCAPPGPVADRFARWQLRRFLPVYGSREQAVEAAWSPVEEAPPALRVDLPPGPEAETEARRLVAAACLDWELPHLRESAALIAAELAGNAIRHGTPPLGLVAAARPTYLHIVARDGNPVPPRRIDPVVPDAVPTTGYGLRLVTALAAAWGCVRTAGGKAVWATVRREAVGLPRFVPGPVWMARAT